ncbi:ATP-binding protein, partial [Psychrobacter sp. GW64-MNA-CIBAN-0177]
LSKSQPQNNRHLSSFLDNADTSATLPLALPSSYHRLQHAVNTQQPWLHFSIQDTGIGIGPSEQKAIFSYFTQANPQVSAQFGGTGLG